MSADGLSTVDGIGAIFSDLKVAVDARSTSIAKTTNTDISDLSTSKLSLYFVHDLVLFVGPLTHSELIDVLVAAFGKKSYDVVKNLLGILREARLISSDRVENDWIYRATTTASFLQYSFDTNALMATFRRFHFQNNSSRFANEHSGTRVLRPISAAIAA